MDDIEFQIFDKRMQMLALSVTAAVLLTKDGANFQEAVTTARRIVFDALTSADAGNY